MSRLSRHYTFECIEYKLYIFEYDWVYISSSQVDWVYISSKPCAVIYYTKHKTYLIYYIYISNSWADIAYISFSNSCAKYNYYKYISNLWIVSVLLLLYVVFDPDVCNKIYKSQLLNWCL